MKTRFRLEYGLAVSAVAMQENERFLLRVTGQQIPGPKVQHLGEIGVAAGHLLQEGLPARTVCSTAGADRSLLGNEGLSCRYLELAGSEIDNPGRCAQCVAILVPPFGNHGEYRIRLGVMLDDIFAGIYAALALLALQRLW